MCFAAVDTYTCTCTKLDKAGIEADLIETDLHTKPTDRHICMESCHLEHCRTTIPYSQVLRLCRICSEEINFLKMTLDLKQHF